MMKTKSLFYGFMFFLLMLTVACGSGDGKSKKSDHDDMNSEAMQELVNKYVLVQLTTDISHLSDNEREMLRLLFEASKLMDDVFWMQNTGDKDAFLSTIQDPYAKQFAQINYGPWDVLDNMKPFIEGYGEKPAGSQFYPPDMTKEEFEALDHPDKTSLYTLIRRNDHGGLEVVWYSDAYATQHQRTAELLLKASELAGDKEFARYLELRAGALLTDKYQESDMAWMDVRNNNIDLVIGPIENYTDRLFGYKAAHEAFILIKDIAWSDRLSKYATFLPQLQQELPVDPAYKKEIPGSDEDLNAYDVIYYAGDCNMASKTIAINLPNDEQVQLQKGSRKLQLKNAMKAKFDHILMPIAQKLIHPDQQHYITFDAFFSNTMFHEVAHGMGIKNTIDGKGTVRQALREQYSPLEEGKADILGLYLVTRLHEMGEFPDTDLMENYVTFMAGIFRSVRFGAASAHGKANMVRFNYFSEKGAFAKDSEGYYSVDMEKMKEAAAEMMQMILKIQGDGNYEAARQLVEDIGHIMPELQADLDRLTDAGIPVDIVFEQGPHMVGF
ncbi:MAG: dipeptidyl-peptidase 3 family protein [Bacteroidales bacterium]